MARVPGRREQIVKDRVEPLLMEVINICQAEGIPMIISLELDKGEDGDYIVNSSVVAPEYMDSHMLQALACVIYGFINAGAGLSEVAH